MSFSRRQFLLSGISLSGILLNPLKAFSWGSFDGIANTHQLIVKNAMQGLLKDPVMKFNLFPSEKDILNSDWVNGIYGTGPDVEGFSNYSDHYYNPKIENKGNGPNASGTQFHNLILKLSQSSNDKTAAKCAAWAAHFLNDMHVPYHVIGITGREAYIKYNRGHEYLTPDESGPLVLYGPQLKAKPGWGQNQNFLLALERYVEKHISARGEVGLVDWHDPWYDNGIGIGLAKTVFGSHSKWELLAHRGWSYEKAKKVFQKLFDESYYDPQWKNHKRPLHQNPWTFAGQQAKDFAIQCAEETRRKIIFYYGYPTNTIIRAIRSTLTLFRSALTSIKIETIQYIRVKRGQYKIICKLHNTHKGESFQAVDVRLHWREKGDRWRTEEVIRLNDDLRPTNYVDVWWFIPLRFSREVEIKCDVNGFYPTTPDLGFREKKLKFTTYQDYQEPEPERIPDPQPVTPSQNPGYCGVWKVNRTCIKDNINNSNEYLGETYTRHWTLSPLNGGQMIKISESRTDGTRTFVEFKKPGTSGPTYFVTHTFQHEGRYITKHIIKLSVSKNRLSGTWTKHESFRNSGKSNGSRTYTITGISKIKSYD